MLDTKLYTIEEVRLRLIEEIKTHGSITGCCIKLGISTGVYYQIKYRTMLIPVVVQELLKISKVMEGNRCIGYVCRKEIDWSSLWI